jgi:hypothetical protein
MSKLTRSERKDLQKFYETCLGYVKDKFKNCSVLIEAQCLITHKGESEIGHTMVNFSKLYSFFKEISQYKDLSGDESLQSFIDEILQPISDCEIGSVLQVDCEIPLFLYIVPNNYDLKTHKYRQI